MRRLAQLKKNAELMRSDLWHLRGDPWRKLKGLRVLVQQTVGELIDHATIGIKAGRWRIQRAEELRFEIGQDVVFIPRTRASRCRASCKKGRGTHHAGDGANQFHFLKPSSFKEVAISHAN